MLTLVSRFRRIKLSAAAKTIGGLALVLFGGLLMGDGLSGG